jgi:hypothetical protein
MTRKFSPALDMVICWTDYLLAFTAINQNLWLSHGFYSSLIYTMGVIMGEKSTNFEIKIAFLFKDACIFNSLYFWSNFQIIYFFKLIPDVITPMV